MTFTDRNDLDAALDLEPPRTAANLETHASRLRKADILKRFQANRLVHHQTLPSPKSANVDCVRRTHSINEGPANEAFHDRGHCSPPLQALSNAAVVG